jgi:hypothetical protein
MLAAYDADPVGALAAALAVVVDRPGATWEASLAAADLADGRRRALLAGDLGALDELAAELNELRTLAR